MDQLPVVRAGRGIIAPTMLIELVSFVNIPILCILDRTNHRFSCLILSKCNAAYSQSWKLSALRNVSSQSSRRLLDFHQPPNFWPRCQLKHRQTESPHWMLTLHQNEVTSSRSAQVAHSILSRVVAIVAPGSACAGGTTTRELAGMSN